MSGAPALQTEEGGLVGGLWLYYLKRGFQLSVCSGKQKLNNDAERNNVPQGGATGHVLARLEEQGSKGRKSNSYPTLFNPERGDLVEEP